MTAEESMIALAKALQEGKKIVIHSSANPVKTRIRVAPKWSAKGYLTEVGTIEIEVEHKTVDEAMEHIEDKLDDLLGRIKGKAASGDYDLVGTGNHKD